MGGQRIRLGPLNPGRYVPSNLQSDDLPTLAPPGPSIGQAQVQGCAGSSRRWNRGCTWAHETWRIIGVGLPPSDCNLRRPRITSHRELAQPPNQSAASSFWPAIRCSPSTPLSSFMLITSAEFPFVCNAMQVGAVGFPLLCLWPHAAAGLGTLGATGQLQYQAWGRGTCWQKHSRGPLSRPPRVNLTNWKPICRPIASAQDRRRDPCRLFFPPWPAPSARPDPSSPAD